MSNFTEMSDEQDIKLWSDFMSKALVISETIIATIVSLWFIFAASVIGNLLTCIVIYCDKSMHTVTNYYLFNLAVSDLSLTFGIVLNVGEQTMDKHFSQWACKAHWFILISLWNYSILTMTALAIERYIAIYYPLKMKSTSVLWRVLKIIVLMWLVAMVETAPEMLTVSVMKTSHASICFIIPSRLARVVNGVLAVITYVIPLSIMTFVYIMIVLKINAKQKNDLRNSVSNYRSSRGKVNKLIIVMSTAFLVSWTPFFIMRVLISTLDIKEFMKLTNIWAAIFKYLSFSTWFCVILNPIVFSFVSTKFRKSLKTLWRSKIRRLRQHDVHLEGLRVTRQNT